MSATERISREILAGAHALPASIVDLPGGGALVTIGTIACPYANAARARDQLQAMARQGRIRLEAPAPSPC